MSERELLAAELALGLLEPDARAHALRLRLSDPEFAGLVGKWEARAANWYDELPTATVSEGLWSRIAAATGVNRSEPLTTATSMVRPATWRAMAIASTVAALVFAGLWAFGLRPGHQDVGADPTFADVTGDRPFGPGTLQVAQITGPEERDLVSAVYDRRSGRLVLRLASLEHGSRVPVLWILDAKGQPRFLGELSPGRAVTLQLDTGTRAAFNRGAAIALSLEPPSGLPYVTPKGPILGDGELHSI